MHKAITKLARTEIQPHLIYLYFNTYLAKSVLFRCGIVKLTLAQTTELQKMYKVIIAKKLRLGSTFLRAILYSRQNVMGLGLIKPIIVIVMLASKQFIRNIRLESRLNKLI